MCADEKFVAKAAAPSRRDNSASPHRKESTSAEGQGFSPAISQRARARYLSRLFTRAKYSVLPSSHLPRTACHLPVLPETVIRVETHVSHRKQTTGHASTRDVPAHNFCVFSRRIPTAGETPPLQENVPSRRAQSALALCSLGGRSFSSVINSLAKARYRSRWFTRARCLVPAPHRHVSLKGCRAEGRGATQTLT
jgi:hypothetical protein